LESEERAKAVQLGKGRGRRNNKYIAFPLEWTGTMIPFWPDAQFSSRSMELGPIGHSMAFKAPREFG
jgi:hypothetical protein